MLSKIMNWLRPPIKNPENKERTGYIGRVKEETYYTDNEGNKTGEYQIGFWILTVSNGKRLCEYVGHDHGRLSEFAINKRAKVKAWVKGGPLPALEVESAPIEPEPKPKPELIVYDFGRKAKGE